MAEMDAAGDWTSPPRGAAQQTVLIAKHTTNTGAVVDLLHTDYGKTVRVYSLRLRSALGPQSHALLRLLSLHDVVLFIVLLAVAVLFVIPRTEYLFGCWDVMSAVPVDSLVSCYAMAAFGVVAVWRILAGVRRVCAVEVIALRGLGLQLRNYNVFGSALSQRFIDRSLIRALIIHDAYFRSQAIFFLSVTVEGEASRAVLFEEFLPRLEVLRPVLRGLRHILFDEPEEGPTLAEMEENDAGRLEDGTCGSLNCEDESDVTDESFSFAELPHQNSDFTSSRETLS